MVISTSDCRLRANSAGWNWRREERRTLPGVRTNKWSWAGSRSGQVRSDQVRSPLWDVRQYRRGPGQAIRSGQVRSGHRCGTGQDARPGVGPDRPSGQVRSPLWDGQSARRRPCQMVRSGKVRSGHRCTTDVRQSYPGACPDKRLVMAASRGPPPPPAARRCRY